MDYSKAEHTTSECGSPDVNAVGILAKGEYVVFQVHLLLPSLRERAIAKLGLTENEVFPLQYVVRVSVEGQAGVVQGVIS